MSEHIPYAIAMLVLGFLAGVWAGWLGKTRQMIQDLRVERSGDHWLLYLGSRIVGRSTNEVQIYRRKRHMAIEIGGESEADGS